MNDHSAHLLAIDIGNTNIVFGVHDGQQWAYHWRVQTVRERMPDEYAVMFRTFLNEAGLELDSFEQVVISSVVPQLTRGIARMVAERTGFAPVIVSAQIDTGIRVNTDHPERVGSDRIADAAAAYARVGGNCIVVDFGTATSFTIVKAPGEMIGAVIAAGLNTTADALVSRAAQLAAGGAGRAALGHRAQHDARHAGRAGAGAYGDGGRADRAHQGGAWPGAGDRDRRAGDGARPADRLFRRGRSLADAGRPAPDRRAESTGGETGFLLLWGRVCPRSSKHSQ